MALTVAAVPTGMKAGVRIMPRGVEMAPVRARPSVAWTANENSSLTVAPRSRLRGLRAVQKAGVPERIKPISGLNSAGIGRLHRLKTAEGRDKHEQGRSRQMKVGHERVNAAKLIARGDENIGVTRKRSEPSGLVGGALDDARGGRTDADDPASALPAPRSARRLWQR